ncbi:MAG TPA: hypothetical protein VEK34_02835, partial [Methylocella sp.]|nr:hypothetical protein [Methylocella sp.]
MLHRTGSSQTDPFFKSNCGSTENQSSWPEKALQLGVWGALNHGEFASTNLPREMYALIKSNPSGDNVMSNVPPPSSGLGSNSNYFLTNSGTDLNGVATTIAVSTDIVASAGFGFQLNAYSPDNETCAIQQYVINVDTSGQMNCIVNNWQNASTPLINNWVALYKLPSSTLPAGYQCRVALQNDRAGNVTAATYTVSALGVAPAPGSALDGYQTSFNNQQHVNYIGTDGHVHELVYTSHWGHTDLTAAAGAPAAAAGSALDGYQTSFNNQQHVNYIGTDGHVH